jgi:hypothetical protein
MIEKTCRCGKTKKNFKVDIGPFFVDELGKKKVELEDIGLDKSKVDEVLNSEETQNLEIVDEGEQPDPQEEAQPEESKDETPEEVDMDKEVEEAIQETIAEDAPKQEPKKKRQYNRNGKIKTQP